jgi:hypothetical protein
MRSFCSRFSGRADTAVVIEADERVVYGYLYLDGQIEGDVWIFNRVAAPIDAPWIAGDEPPYAIPLEFSFTLRNASNIEPDDFRVVYRPDDPTKAAIYFRNILVATLWPGARPGKSAFARKSSPVATAFENPGSNLPQEWLA